MHRGAGRYNGTRPRWVVLHPGRIWADKCAMRPETAKDIGLDVETYLPPAVLLTEDKLIGPNPGRP